GPIAKDHAFFFGSFEGYRLDAGFNNVELVPSDAARARAVPAIAALRAGFVDPAAVMLAGNSTNPDFDIAQLQATQVVRENAVSATRSFASGRSACSTGRTSPIRGDAAARLAGE